MKEIIKALLIVSFLGIMIPSGKLTIPNGGLILTMASQIIEYSLEENPKLSLNSDSILAIATTISLAFIIIKRKLFNLIGISLQFIWLGYLLWQNRWEDLKDVLLITTISVYISMSIILIYRLYFKQDKTINSN